MLGLPPHFAIPIQPEPGKVLPDCQIELGPASSGVDVLDTQQEPPARLARRLPAFPSRADMTEMQIARRAWREAGNDRQRLHRVNARLAFAPRRKIFDGIHNSSSSCGGCIAALKSDAYSIESITMNLTLSGPSHPPHSGGKAESRLVILLHGLGADGSGLIGLAPYWAPFPARYRIPDRPNAPYPCDMAPHGYQWLSVRETNPEARLAGARAAAAILDGFIDEALASRGLTESDLALVGFSQGTMMSLFVGPRREQPLAGIVGYSGRLIAPQLLAGELRSRPPILLIHGTEDPMVPYASMAEAETSLTAAGIPVETLACPGIGHSIDGDGLQAGGKFLHACSSPA